MGNVLKNVTQGQAAYGTAVVNCVVLLSGDHMGEGLLSSLRSCVGEPSIVRDAPAVMVDLARGATVLIISEPHQCQFLDRLLAAVHRFYPRVLCWRYDPTAADGRPRLCPLSQPLQDDVKSTMHDDESDQSSPSGDLTMAQGVALDFSQTHSTDEESLEPLVSAEELRMLLGPRPD